MIKIYCGTDDRELRDIIFKGGGILLEADREWESWQSLLDDGSLGVDFKEIFGEVVPKVGNWGMAKAIPIIMFAKSKDGWGLSIEYPEMCLHPAIQHRLIMWLVGRRIDLAMSTHSYVVVNAVRVAIKRGLIKAEEVKLYYEGEEVAIGDGGEIVDWKEGLFDQIDKDFEELFGI